MRAGVGATIPVFLQAPGNTSGVGGVGVAGMTVNYSKNAGAAATKPMSAAWWLEPNIGSMRGQYGLVLHAFELDTPGWFQLSVQATSVALYADRFELLAWDGSSLQTGINALLTTVPANQLILVNGHGALQTSIDNARTKVSAVQTGVNALLTTIPANQLILVNGHGALQTSIDAIAGGQDAAILAGIAALQTSEDVHYGKLMNAISTSSNAAALQTTLNALITGDIRTIKQAVSGKQKLDLSKVPPVLTVYSIDNSTILYEMEIDDDGTNRTATPK